MKRRRATRRTRRRRKEEEEVEAGQPLDNPLDKPLDNPPDNPPPVFLFMVWGPLLIRDAISHPRSLIIVSFSSPLVFRARFHVLAPFALRVGRPRAPRRKRQLMTACPYPR